MTTNQNPHRAVLTVTVTTRPDGGHYFDQADFTGHVTEWVRAALKGRHAVDDVTIAAAVSVPPPVDRAALRDRIRRALCEASGNGFMWDSFMLEPDEYGEVADAVLAVLPEPANQAEWDALCRETDRLRKAWDEMQYRAQRIEAEVQRLTADRAAVLLEAADFAEDVAEKLRAHHEFERSTGALDVMTELRRLAAETQQPEPGPTIAALDGQETGTVFSPGEGVYGQDPYYVGVVAQQPECSASVSGSCLAEAQSETACDTDGGECVHGGRPGDVARQQPDTETGPQRLYPARNTWTFEVCYDPDADKWHGCGATYDSSVFENAHETAKDDFRYRVEHDRQRRKFRLGRATTTYAVEAEHQAPAVPVQPAAADTDEETQALRCVCGHPVQLQDADDPTSWIHTPGRDNDCIDARPRCPHCQLPHDLTPGSLPVAACASVRARTADEEQQP